MQLALDTRRQLTLDGREEPPQDGPGRTDGDGSEVSAVDPRQLALWPASVVQLALALKPRELAELAQHNPEAALTFAAIRAEHRRALNRARNARLRARQRAAAAGAAVPAHAAVRETRHVRTLTPQEHTASVTQVTLPRPESAKTAAPFPPTPPYPRAVLEQESTSTSRAREPDGSPAELPPCRAVALNPAYWAARSWWDSQHRAVTGRAYPWRNERDGRPLRALVERHGVEGFQAAAAALFARWRAAAPGTWDHEHCDLPELLRHEAALLARGERLVKAAPSAPSCGCARAHPGQSCAERAAELERLAQLAADQDAAELRRRRELAAAEKPAPAAARLTLAELRDRGLLPDFRRTA